MFAPSLFINLPLLQSIPNVLLERERPGREGRLLKIVQLKGIEAEEREREIPLCPLNKTLCIYDVNFDALLPLLYLLVVLLLLIYLERCDGS